MDQFGSTCYATADRTEFNTDLTTAVTTANLTTVRAECASVGNPDVAGYVGGGKSTGTAVVATTDKLTFSSETTAAASTANITSARTYCAGVSERSAKAYFLGGSTSSGSGGRVVTADLLTFSGDTTAAQTTADLSVTRYGASGLTEGSTKGYVGGGSTGTVSQLIATSDKITFSSDATAVQTTANLTTARLDYVPMSDGATKGYWAGGQTGSSISICDKVTFSTDTTASQTSAAMTRHAASGSSNGTIGYAGGGNSSVIGGGITASIHKFTFSTDTNSHLGTSSDLSSNRIRISGVSTAAL